MARPSIKAILEKKVKEYISEALRKSPREMPLSAAAVAKAIGHDRRVLAKYHLDDQLRLAARHQRAASAMGARRKRTELSDRLAALTQERDRYLAENHRLLALLALIEANAKHLDLDPEVLYEPVDTPDRSVSSVFRARMRR